MTKNDCEPIRTGSRNEDIEVLRAVAILFTVMAHFRVLFFWPDSWVASIDGLPFWGGVDLFFCISGFVITGTLMRHARGARFAELGVPFWIRRVFRIWPAALLWLAIPLLCARYFNDSGAFGSWRANVPGASAAAAQVANLYFMVCEDGAGARWPCGRLDVYWSLSLEEQFYLVFPWLFFFLRLPVLRAVLIALVLAQLFLPRPLGSDLWLMRTDAIALGVLIALSCSRGSVSPWLPAPLRERRTATFFSTLLIAMIALLCLKPFALQVGALALVSAGLVLVASANANVICPVPALRPFLLWTGSRSFAIYLAHNPCFWATREIFNRLYPGTAFSDAFVIPVAIVGTGLVILASEATYRIVERPIRDLGRSIADRFSARRAYSSGPRPVPPAAGGADDHTTCGRPEVGGGSKWATVRGSTLPAGAGALADPDPPPSGGA